MNHMDFIFGVEFECYLPEGASQEMAARAVQHRLGRPVAVEGYNHNVRDHWKVVTDGSLQDMARGCEFVSPILRGADGLAQVEAVCRALTDFGCTVSKRCGFHVHVGAQNAPLTFFKRLVRLYAAYEPVIDAMMPASRRGSTNMFCRAMTSANLPALERASNLDDIINAACHASRSESRYHKVNLLAYRRHRTVEFRQHSGTLDGVKARRWTVLCLRMVAVAMDETIALGSGDPRQSTNRARQGTKAHQIGQMLLRSQGVTAREIMTATGWPSVSIPQQAGICGIAFTTQRTGREVRYFAVTAAAPATMEVSIDGLASLLRADEDERAYLRQRTADLAGPVQWAA